MTNREIIAELKVVDFFAKYVYMELNDFDRFISESIICSKCPKQEECDKLYYCKKVLTKWLDEEV